MATFQFKISLTFFSTKKKKELIWENRTRDKCVLFYTQGMYFQL